MESFARTAKTMYPRNWSPLLAMADAWDWHTPPAAVSFEKRSIILAVVKNYIATELELGKLLGPVSWAGVHSSPIGLILKAQ